MENSHPLTATKLTRLTTHGAHHLEQQLVGWASVDWCQRVWAGRQSHCHLGGWAWGAGCRQGRAGTPGRCSSARGLLKQSTPTLPGNRSSCAAPSCLGRWTLARWSPWLSEPDHTRQQQRFITWVVGWGVPLNLSVKPTQCCSVKEICVWHSLGFGQSQRQTGLPCVWCSFGVGQSQRQTGLPCARCSPGVGQSQRRRDRKLTLCKM